MRFLKENWLAASQRYERVIVLKHCISSEHVDMFNLGSQIVGFRLAAVQFKEHGHPVPTMECFEVSNVHFQSSHLEDRNPGVRGDVEA